MLTLYHVAQSRSVRPRWMLEELGVPYEIVRLDMPAGAHKQPEYLRINPNGTVPTLIDDGVPIWESGAIVTHLADRFPDRHLAPPPGTTARGLCHQWSYFAMCTLEPPIYVVFLQTALLPEAERMPQLLPPAREKLDAAVAVVDAALAGRPWLLGDAFSAADVMVASTLWWCRMLGALPPTHARAADYVERAAARPAFVRAMAD